jgi:hypothetical protein
MAGLRSFAPQLLETSQDGMQNSRTFTIHYSQFTIPPLSQAQSNHKRRFDSKMPGFSAEVVHIGGKNLFTGSPNVLCRKAKGPFFRGKSRR